MTNALLIAAAIVSVGLLVAGVALWLWRPRETRADDVGLALLSGAVIALVVFGAQVGIEARIRDADQAARDEEKQALRLSLSSSRSLEGIDLSDRSDLQGIYLGRKRLRYSLLGGADMSGSSLVLADLRETDLREASLRGAQLRRADLERAFITSADLDAADLSFADLAGARLSWASLAGASLRSVTARNAEMIRSDFEQADLQGADLSGTDARKADFTGANLRDAVLDFADFGGADPRLAQFGSLRRLPGRESVLEEFLEYLKDPALGVSFRVLTREARFGELRVLGDFRGADLRGADLREAAFSCAVIGGFGGSPPDVDCSGVVLDPGDYRRLLAATSVHEESPQASQLAEVLTAARYSVPSGFVVDPLAGMDEERARKVLESEAFVRDVFVPLTGLRSSRPRLGRVGPNRASRAPATTPPHASPTASTSARSVRCGASPEASY